MHYPKTIPSPYVATVHPYPTRYHGSINTRPVFGFPYVQSPHQVLVPSEILSGVGAWDVADGIFRRPEVDGGGVFNNASVLGSIDTTTALTFVAGALLGFLGVDYYLEKKGR